MLAIRRPALKRGAALEAAAALPLDGGMDAGFDYLIVGAGTAGCLLANRLSADPGARVLLLEAGGSDAYHWVRIPVGYLYCIGNPRTDWMYLTEPEPGLNGRRLRYPRGKVLGGCSSINGMIYMRGQARDYDAWAELTGDDAWSWENALPDFIAHESHWRLDAGDDPEVARFHGAAGELRVEKQRLHWDILDAFRAACVEAGIPDRDDFNDGDNEGVGYFEVNQKGGWRWNAVRAFLKPVESRRNLVVRTGAEAARLDPRAPRRRPRLHRRHAHDRRDPARPPRRHPRRRRRQQPEAAAALRPRPRRAPARARHRGRRRPAGGRRQPAGPPADPQRLQGQGREDPERAREPPARQGPDRASNTRCAAPAR